MLSPALSQQHSVQWSRECHTSSNHKLRPRTLGVVLPRQYSAKHECGFVIGMFYSSIMLTLRAYGPAHNATTYEILLKYSFLCTFSFCSGNINSTNQITVESCSTKQHCNSSPNKSFCYTNGEATMGRTWRPWVLAVLMACAALQLSSGSLLDSLGHVVNRRPGECKWCVVLEPALAVAQQPPCR